MPGRSLEYPELIKSPEFVPEWDVLRDAQGRAITVECSYGVYNGPPLTNEQLDAVRHALVVWDMVCKTEGSSQAEKAKIPSAVKTVFPVGTEFNWRHANVAKSRLLERMIHWGLPPTKTKPPIDFGGPGWWLLPGGDPFWVE